MEVRADNLEVQDLGENKVTTQPAERATGDSLVQGLGNSTDLTAMSKTSGKEKGHASQESEMMDNEPNGHGAGSCLSPPPTTDDQDNNMSDIAAQVRDMNLDQPEDPLLPFVDKGLTNAIHPIFAREQFSVCPQQYYDLYLRPTLRLASRLIAMDSVVKHLVVMVDGELRRDTEPWGASVPTDLADLQSLKGADGKSPRPNLSRHPTAAQEKVDDIMRHRADEIWRHLKPVVRIVNGSLPDRHCYGTTEFPWEPRQARLFPGVSLIKSSLITINNAHMDEMKTLYDERNKFGRRATDLEWDLEARELRLASTLIHELFHAVSHRYHAQMVFDGLTSCETFYADHPLAECGFAGEAAALGGTLVMYTGKDLGQGPAKWRGWAGTSLLLRDWQTQSFLDEYRENGHPMGSRSLLGSLSDAKSHLVLPIHFGKLFQDKFWEADAPKLGQKPLFQHGVLSTTLLSSKKANRKKKQSLGKKEPANPR